ncbi:hypothetical protein BDZ45DRAFT_699385 [Acephala macrosclerotiorum]|nr:hypothetical protein BDZ45DRAFT_699385 [Acephala macrosclerotiorum]
MVGLISSSLLKEFRSTMKLFLLEYSESSNSNSNNTDDTNAIRAAGLQFEASQQSNLTIPQRIAVELAACDTVLSGYFSAEGGFHIIKDAKMTRPPLTQDGEVVPASHVRLSHVMVIGQAVPRVVHLYAHPYKILGMGDVLGYLPSVARELGVRREGDAVFRLGIEGVRFRLFRLEGILWAEDIKNALCPLVESSYVFVDVRKQNGPVT